MSEKHFAKKTGVNKCIGQMDKTAGLARGGVGLGGQGTGCFGCWGQ